MLNVPTISVIIPAFNCADTLRETVESVFAQTFEDYEIIIVDDGSKDKTLEVAKALERQDKRVRVFAQANQGAAATRNTAIKNAIGKYIALLDSDDLWLPEKLEIQLEILNSDESVQAVQSGAYFVDSESRIIGQKRCKPSIDALLETLLFQNLVATMSTLVIRRDMFKIMGLFDTDLEILEEWDMSIKVARYCNLVSIEEPLAKYRIFEGNRSRNLQIHIKPGFLVLDRLFSDDDLPDSIKAKKSLIYSRFYTMLSGGCLKIYDIKGCVFWGLKAAATNPRSLSYILAMPIRRVKRYYGAK